MLWTVVLTTPGMAATHRPEDYIPQPSFRVPAQTGRVQVRTLLPFITATLYLGVTPYFLEHFQPLPDVPNEAVGLGALCEPHAAQEGNRTHSGTHLSGDPACSSAQGPKALSPPTASHEITTAASKRSKGCYGREASSDPWVCRCGRRG